MTLPQAQMILADEQPARPRKLSLAEVRAMGLR